MKKVKLFEQFIIEKRPEWKDSDAPDANGRFRDLSPKDLAAWLIKTRDKDLQKITGSLNQQIVFNRNEDPEYADKMEKTRIEVYKQLGRKDLLNASEGYRYHTERGLDITNSVYRLGSTAYRQLFEETKKYWDEDNVILKDKAAWMVKNLQVGKAAKFKTSDGKMVDVELDTPSRGGDKKFQVYRDSGKKDDDDNIIAKRLTWGDTTGLSIKNDDPDASASFWARQQCDLAKKMDPDTAGFWACYAPSLFGKQLGLSSEQPW